MAGEPVSGSLPEIEAESTWEDARSPAERVSQTEISQPVPGPPLVSRGVPPPPAPPHREPPEAEPPPSRVAESGLGEPLVPPLASPGAGPLPEPRAEPGAGEREGAAPPEVVPASSRLTVPDDEVISDGRIELGVEPTEGTVQRSPAPLPPVPATAPAQPPMSQPRAPRRGAERSAGESITPRPVREGAQSPATLEPKEDLVPVPRASRSEGSKSRAQTQEGAPVTLVPVAGSEATAGPTPGSGPEASGAAAVRPETLETLPPGRHRMPEIQPSVVLVPQPPAPAVVPREIVARREPAGPVPEGDGAAIPEPSVLPPSVQVTIGRVDVRAVMPPAPPAPPTPPARRTPALSLDDYLKRRNEGKP